MSDDNKTSLYNSGNTEDDKTSIYQDVADHSASDSGQDNTGTYTDQESGLFSSTVHGIQVRDQIELKEKTYEVTEILSYGTGEAVIYKVRETSFRDGGVYVVKLYFEFANPKHEPNQETLARISEISDPDILNLIDFGVGDDKYKGRYCYELVDFAAGSDLLNVADFKTKYTEEFILSNVIPEIFKGIKRLHSHNIFHCDLKPNNIFYLNEEQTDLVIGDYGSAKSYDPEAVKKVVKTSTVKGTETYLAPEQPRGVVTQKNDYYSFGMVLLHLLYPEQLTEPDDIKKFSKGKYEQLVERQMSRQPIIDYDNKYDRINRLIEGLTLQDFHDRWGKEEVEAWINGEDIAVNYHTTSGAVRHIKLGTITIIEAKDLITFLDSRQDWYEDLIEDEDTYRNFIDWLNSYRDIPTRKVVHSMIENYNLFGKEFIKESLIRFFEPDQEIAISETRFKLYGTSDPVKVVSAILFKLDEVWKKSTFKEIQFYLFQLEFCLHQYKQDSTGPGEQVLSALLLKLYAAFGVSEDNFENFHAKIPPKISPNRLKESYKLIIELFLKFFPDRGFKDLSNNSYQSLAEIGLFLIQNENHFENDFIASEKEVFLEVNGLIPLCDLNYRELLFTIFNQESESKIEVESITFDSHRNYTIRYQYFTSLTNFLKSKNLDIVFISESGSPETYKLKRNRFETFRSVCERFIHDAKLIHNIGDLTASNLRRIQSQFITRSWKRFLYVHSGQFLALLILIFSSTVIILIFNDKIAIGNGDGIKLLWRDKTPASDSEVQFESYQNFTDLNMRSRPSTNGTSLMIIPKYSTVSVISKGYIDSRGVEWYYVEHNGTKGYASANYLNKTTN